jgi:3-oxoacyl-[acyl-carrier-protein] synthase II
MLSKNNDNPSRACKPFDRYRDGGVMAEGAAFLVLESLEHARARSARIYAEVVGFAETAVGVDPRFMKEGLKVVMRKALDESHLSPGDIDYISAHAPSDPMTDKMEVLAIKSVFGTHTYRIPISSIKAIIGSPFAAAGPMQVISTVLAMETGYLPPTCNYEHPDPDCDIDVVPNCPRRNIIEHALINSHGLGGTDSALVLRRFAE